MDSFALWGHAMKTKDEILSYIGEIGFDSAPIITLATLFSGVIVSNEIAWHMNKALGDYSLIPGFTAQFIFRELGIAVPALLLISKAGASISATVSNMKISEQFEAMEMFGLKPKTYVFFPIWVATQVSLVMLTLLSLVTTLMCAALAAVAFYGFTWGEYFNAVRDFLHFSDLALALTKAWVFGAVFPLIACYYGYQCEASAEGVGRSATTSVVVGTIVTIVLDFILTFVFTYKF